MDSQGGLNEYQLWSSTGIQSNYSFGIRAVVGLKSNIKLSGSSSSGWTLEK